MSKLSTREKHERSERAKPDPAPCQHRELLKVVSVNLGLALQVAKTSAAPVSALEMVEANKGMIDHALAQPCQPAQGEAGEWEPVHELRLGGTRFVEIGSLGLYRRRAKGGEPK